MIKYGEEVLGELQNVHIAVAKKPFGEDDARWGIAIVKNGKQTVTRFRDFPPEIPEELRRRIFGWCDAHCTSAVPFLKAAENPSHTGYLATHTTYRQVKRELRAIVKRLAEPFMTSGDKVTEKEASEAKELLEAINEALESVPELDLFGVGSIKKPPEPQRPKDYVYLSRIDLENRRYSRGETVQVKAIIKNPTSKELLVRSNFEHYDTTPVVVDTSQEGVILNKGTIEAPSTGQTTWNLLIDERVAPGIHTVQVALQDATGQPMPDADGAPVKGRHWLYVEVDPPTIKRGKGTDGTGRKGFNTYQWFKKKDLPTFEATIDMSQMAAFVNRMGRRLAYSIDRSASKRAYWPLVAELVSEKIVELLLERELTTKDMWVADEARKVIGRLEDARVRFIHEMVKIVERIEGKGIKAGAVVVTK